MNPARLLWCSLGAILLLSTPSLAQEKVDFEKQIKPLFEKSCVKCHGPEKPKGRFRIDQKEPFLKGGGQGEPIVPGKSDESLLFELITLEADDPERMPAEGDPLTEEEIDLVKKWIDEGAEWPDGLALTVPEGPKRPMDPLNTPGLEITEDEKAAVVKAQELGALALRIAQNTNWLRVDFSLQGKEVKDEDLVILAKMPNLVELDLGNTKVSDGGLSHLKDVKNLHRLHLEKTPINGAGLANISHMEELRYLNLYGTQVTDDGLAHLAGLKKLKKLYLWQTKVTDEGVEKLQAALPELMINRGLDAKPKEEEKKEEGEKKEEEKKEGEKKEEEKKEDKKKE